MYEFSATVNDDNSIEIVSNTYWNCKLEGNFMLSSYDGSGDTTIDIEIPDDIRIAEGNIYFSYGDERCIYPELYIFTNNDCYIETNPNYIECDNGEKTIYLYYEEPLETFTVSINCFDGWKVDSSDFDYITTDNEVMIISNDENGENKETQIKPTHDCDGKNIIHIKLKKKATI